MTSAFFWQNLLAFALLHSVLHSQIWLLLQVFLDFLILHSIPLEWKGHLFWVLVLLYSNYSTVALILQTSKVMLKILQARLQQDVNPVLSDVQAGFRKDRGTRDQIVNICWIIEKAREFQKNIYFCFIDCAKAFDCVDHRKLWKILKEIGLPDHLTWLLRILYGGQKATVRTGHGTTD